MANSPQARKRARQNVKRRLHNMSQRSNLRSVIKKFLRLISESDKEAATATYKEATSKIDRGVSKGLHHKNRAARLKARLHSKLKNISA